MITPTAYIRMEGSYARVATHHVDVCRGDEA